MEDREYYKLKPQIKQRWIEALRSGRFKQGKSNLHYKDMWSEGENRFCCLGVLCEILVEDGILRRTDPVTELREDGTIEVVSYSLWDPEGQCEENATSVLPETILDRIAEDGYDFGVDGSLNNRRKRDTPSGTEYAYTLVDLNDTWGYDFQQIADVIEGEF